MAWGDNPWIKSWPIEIDKPHGKDIIKAHKQEWPLSQKQITTIAYVANELEFNKAADEAMNKASAIPWPIQEVFKSLPTNYEFMPTADGIVVIKTSIEKDDTTLAYKIYGVDLSSEKDKSVTVVIENNVIIKEYSNKVPTHDPYTNPNSHIYYQCSCGSILDPGTKSFAQLNNIASREGWKVRWGADTYIPYCVDCGKDVD